MGFKKVLLLFLVVFAQSSYIKLSAQIKTLHCKTYNKDIEKLTIPKRLKTSDDTLSFLRCLKFIINDSLDDAKGLNIISLTSKLTSRFTNTEIIHEAVSLYSKMIKNKSFTIFNVTLAKLKRIQKSYFDSSQVEDLVSTLDEKCTNLKDYVLFIGFIGNETTIPKARSLLNSERKLTKPEIWSIYLSLARLGDELAIDYVVDRVKSLPLNSRLIEAIYPDLIYTKQEKIYDIMIDAIYSDELLCDSSNPDSDQMIICGYRIIELIAPHIYDFPIKTLPSGDLSVTSYPEALQQAREWFIQNRSSYRIVRSSF